MLTHVLDENHSEIIQVLRLALVNRSQIGQNRVLTTMQNIDEVIDRLRRSTFRQRFRLAGAEREYLDRKGLDVILEHAADFIDKRLAPAEPANDGKQTPMRNHPVFIAQHATATCCRGCLEKWHGISKGHELTAEEKQQIIDVIRRWLLAQSPS
jgi:hypothetical protein